MAFLPIWASVDSLTVAITVPSDSLMTDTVAMNVSDSLQLDSLQSDTTEIAVFNRIIEEGYVRWTYELVQNDSAYQEMEEAQRKIWKFTHPGCWFAYFKVAYIIALILCIRFSASSNTTERGPSNTSLVTSNSS